MENVQDACGEANFVRQMRKTQTRDIEDNIIGASGSSEK